MGKQSKEAALRRLQVAKDAIQRLKTLPRRSQDFQRWSRNTEVAILNTFEGQSRHIKEFNRIPYSPAFVTSGTSDQIFQRAYVRGLDSAGSVLASMIDEINEYWEETEVDPVVVESTNQSANQHDVFVIHGRDNEIKETVARFLGVLQLNPVILHEQPSQGRTIIEKFEDHAHAAFAVALLTPDDVGGLESERGELKRRARQNVIFEFGYFVGRIGRERVCAITKGNVELPSDYNGVVYIPIDDTGWKLTLVREMKAAGLDVDANLAL